MHWDLDLLQLNVIKFGGVIVVAAFTVRMIKDAIAAIRKP